MLDVTSAQNQRAADVFFNFVVDANLNEVMGEDWFDNLRRDTEGWTALEAHQFLETLRVENIPTRHVLKILRATEHLKQIKTWNPRDLSIGSVTDEVASDMFFAFIVNALVDDERADILQLIDYLKWLKKAGFTFFKSSQGASPVHKTTSIENINSQTEEQTSEPIFIAKVIGDEWLPYASLEWEGDGYMITIGNTERKLQDLKDFVTFLKDEGYLNTNEIRRRMSEPTIHSSFIKGKLPIFKKLVEYIEDYVGDEVIPCKGDIFVGGKAVIRAILLVGGQFLTDINSIEKLNVFKDLIEFLKGYVDKTTLIRGLIRQRFPDDMSWKWTDSSLNEVKRLVNVIESRYGRQKIVEILEYYSGGKTVHLPIDQLRKLAKEIQEADFYSDKEACRDAVG